MTAPKTINDVLCTKKILSHLTEKTRYWTLQYSQSLISDKQLDSKLNRLEFEAKQQLSEMIWNCIEHSASYCIGVANVRHEGDIKENLAKLGFNLKEVI